MILLRCFLLILCYAIYGIYGIFELKNLKHGLLGEHKFVHIPFPDLT